MKTPVNLYLNPDPSFELDTYFQTTKQLYQIFSPVAHQQNRINRKAIAKTVYGLVFSFLANGGTIYPTVKV